MYLTTVYPLIYCYILRRILLITEVLRKLRNIFQYSILFDYKIRILNNLKDFLEFLKSQHGTFDFDVFFTLM